MSDYPQKSINSSSFTAKAIAPKLNNDIQEEKNLSLRYSVQEKFKNNEVKVEENKENGKSLQEKLENLQNQISKSLKPAKSDKKYKKMKQK